MQPGRNQLHEAKPSAIYLPGCITSAIHHKIAQQHMLLVYVIAWVAVQFGMNCTSNATRKGSIARGEAECYLPSWLHYECNSSQNCTATHAVTN